MTSPTKVLAATQRIHVLLVDNIPMSAQLLADALTRDRRFLVECASCNQSALDAARQHSPDIAVVNATGTDAACGPNLVRELRLAQPAIQCVLLLDAPTPATIVEAFRAGARGVFSRTSSFASLCRCIECVYAGQVWATSTELGYLLEAITENRIAPPEVNSSAEGLSRREEDVVRLVMEGMTNREIAVRLQLSEHTVKNYIFRIFEKLGISTRVELALYALARHSNKRKSIASETRSSGSDQSNSRRTLTLARRTSHTD